MLVRTAKVSKKKPNQVKEKSVTGLTGLQKLERFNSFLSYVRDNYIGTEEKSPRFTVAWWSVFSRVSNGIEKASCRQEAWHRVFSFDIRKKPNLILLINLFLLEQSLVAITVEQLKSGDEFKISKKQELHLTRLRNLVLDYNSYITGDFLEAIASNIRIKKN